MAWVNIGFHSIHILIRGLWLYPSRGSFLTSTINNNQSILNFYIFPAIRTISRLMPRVNLQLRQKFVTFISLSVSDLPNFTHNLIVLSYSRARCTLSYHERTRYHLSIDLHVRALSLFHRVLLNSARFSITSFTKREHQVTRGERKGIISFLRRTWKLKSLSYFK